MRTALGTIIGYLAWTALWLGGNAGIRTAFPTEFDAFAAGDALTATMPLLLSLVLCTFCSLAAGLTAAALGKENARAAVLVTAVLLLLTGIGVQASVWTLMPTWYHLIFLALLVPVCFAGARLKRV